MTDGQSTLLAAACGSVLALIWALHYQTPAPMLPDTTMCLGDPSIVVAQTAVQHTRPTPDASPHVYGATGPVPVGPAKQEHMASGHASVAPRILYYRNPMGLPDTSAAPKKDHMGMDYIPVYEGDAGAQRSVVLSKKQMALSGVRIEVVEARVLVTPVWAAAALKYDDRRVSVVSIGVEATIDEVHVRNVGQVVRRGESLLRLSSSNPQMLQIEAARRNRGQASSDPSVQNLLTGNTSASVEWTAPISGVVIEKKAFAGQRVGMTDEVFRIADASSMWLVADVAEADLGRIKPGQRADVIFRSEPGVKREASVAFILPELKAETRTGRVVLEIANGDSRLKAEMSAEVVLRTGADGDPVVALPYQAIIDDGTAQRVIVALGEGRFEQRLVTLGRRTPSFVEVLAGVAEGESVVTSAHFLIDSEANLNAAMAKLAPAKVAP